MFKVVRVTDEKPGYTVGVKRRFLPGYRKHRVTGHSWENFRFILNLATGEQLLIPGFRATELKIFSDFWQYVKKPALSVPRETLRQGAVAEETRLPVVRAEPEKKMPISDISEVPEKVTQEVESSFNDSYVSPEVLERASQRVRGILQSEGIA